MNEKIILAIDPGNIESGYVLLEARPDEECKIYILKKGICPNEELRQFIYNMPFGIKMVIEVVKSYGMAVGETTFTTVEWIGRFSEAYIISSENKDKPYRIERREVKQHICKNGDAKDVNITTRLVDMFGDVEEHGKYGKGTKKNPGFFYEFSDDIWSAFAIGITYFLKEGILHE